MTTQIIDGTGQGFRVRVNADNMLATIATTVPMQHHTSHVDEETYGLNVQQTPSGANTAFLGILNGASSDINIWELALQCAATETIEVWSVTGTAVGTAVLPSNMHVGSGRGAACTAVAGNAVTGLTKDKLLKRYIVKGGESTLVFPIPPALILGVTQQIAFYAVSGSILVTMCVCFDFHSTSYGA